MKGLQIFYVPVSHLSAGRKQEHHHHTQLASKLESSNLNIIEGTGET